MAVKPVVMYLSRSGEAVARRVSMPLIHGVSALIFLLLGLLTLLNPGQFL